MTTTGRTSDFVSDSRNQISFMTIGTLKTKVVTTVLSNDLGQEVASDDETIKEDEK